MKKNFRKISLVAGFVTLVCFGANAQWTGSNPIISTQPVGVGSPILPPLSGTTNNFTFINYGFWVKTPAIDYADVNKVSANLVVEGAGDKNLSKGATLGFVLNAANSPNYSPYQHGRIMVTPDLDLEGSAKGKMYIQTRGGTAGNPSNLYWQWNKNLVLNSSGAVAINTDCFPSGYMLAVNGKIMATGVKVALSDASGCWPDYVFKKDYKLTPLSEVETFITANSHLPNVPSEAEVKENGINMAEMDAVLLRKIEELTLYMIQLKKENEELSKKVEALSDKQ